MGQASQTDDIEVMLTISDAGFIEPALANPFTISASNNLDVPVMTQLDADSTMGGEIEISIMENSNYFISGRDYQISVTVMDSTSEISITSDFDELSIIEGTAFNFILTANPAPEEDLVVMLTISDSGFIEPALNDSYTISTSGTLEVDVMTQDNSDSDEGGEIEISISESLMYRISATADQINVTVFG